MNQASSVSKAAYQLDPADLAAIESNLVDWLEQLPNQLGLATLILKTDDPSSNFVRTYEASAFADEDYDFHAGMVPYEESSIFLVTVDLEDRAVAHVKRIVAARELEVLPKGPAVTGIEVLDDRLMAVDESESADLQELLLFHDITNIDVCLNLTSNINTNRCAPSRTKPYSLISYKAVFKFAMTLKIENIFAYMNSGAMRSLTRLGVEFVELGGRAFHLPMPGQAGEYDLSYQAVCIPNTRANLEAFTKENPKKPFTKLIAGLDVPLYSM